MSTHKIFLDLLPGNKRSIKNIPIPEHSRKNESSIFSPDSMDIRKKGISKLGVWSAVAVLLIAVFFVTSFVFAGAKIAITPKQDKIEIKKNFTAVLDAQTEGVPYEIISISDQEIREIPATGEEYVEKKASGQITIFNDFNSSTQRLIKNTRFETPEGLIYRIDQTAVVPGQTTKDGKVYPGSVDVVVYADKPGENYNIEMKDFTIPGFKGSPRFDKFYAKSKTAMAGGFSGTIKKVSDDDVKISRNEIQFSLKEKLLKKIYIEKPEGFVLYDNGIFVEYESLPNVDQKDSVQIQEKANLHAIVFDKKIMSNYVAKNIIVDIGSDLDMNIDITNINELDFEIYNNNAVPKVWESKSFIFSLAGMAQLVWQFDEQKLKNSLLGQSKNNVSNILFGYPSIKEAEIKITPFWSSKLPQDPRKIEIENKFTGTEILDTDNGSL